MDATTEIRRMAQEQQQLTRDFAAITPHRNIELATPDFSWPADLRPKAHEIAGIKPGNVVLLYLRDGSACWVWVTSRQQPDGTFNGRVEDSPSSELRRGDRVKFRRCHVFQIV